MTPYAKKSLGQHFMTDTNMVRKIMHVIAPNAKEHIIEIGPGRGALTDPLLNSGCRLTVFELDTALAAGWKEKEHPGFRCIEENVLQSDLSTYFPVDKLVGNIPYNISRPLMYKLYAHRKDIPETVLVVQKEFAEKLTALPGEPAYNILSVLTQIFAETEYLFTLPPNVFSPPPKVDSACIRLRFNNMETDDALLIDCVQKAFRQRRKKLRNSLKAFYKAEHENQFPWDDRADSIAPGEYLRLIDLLKNDQ
jgi:16S rRNA (adenine1518-N6/adenine1519-N6)-dimethyltransferase